MYSEIVSFVPNIADAPGSQSSNEISIGKLLARKLQNLPAPQLSLGRPSVSGDTVLVGTDDPNGQSHFIIALSIDAMENVRKNPILGITGVAEQIRDLRWLSNTSAVCATGKGTMQLFNIAAAEGEIKQLSTVDHAHTDHVRELATQEGQSGLVASGGFEGTLCVTSFVDPQQVQLTNKASLPGKVIGSVKWPAYNSSQAADVCVSCTTDDGCYAMFDTRTKMKTSAVLTDTGKADLFTHARYSDHHLLLGYGDGEIKQLDMRRPAEQVLSVVDPYVEGIGGMEFNATAQAFVVSGFTDCSVWKINHDGRASIWSHLLSGDNLRSNQDGYSVGMVDQS